MPVINRFLNVNVKWLCVLLFSLTLVSDAFSAQIYNLLDYTGPSTVGTTWLYSGRDWDGRPSDTRMQVISTQQTITSYTNGVTATPYSINVIDIRSDYGTANSDHSFTSVDEWHSYVTASDSFRMWGSDDGDESLRIDGGINFGTTLAIGQTNISSSQFYKGGSYVGNASVSLTLLDVSNVMVPAGTFANCLHLRITMTIDDKIQSSDEWWASGVGTVKKLGISGDGSAQLRVLEWYQSTENPPIDPPVEPHKNPQINSSVLLLLLKNK